MRYDEEDEFLEKPTFPGTVRTAGIIWIVFGSLILVNLVVVLLMLFVFAAAAPGRGAAEGAFVGAFCVSVVLGLFGGAFLFVGVQSVRGTAGGTLANGIGSVIFGVIILAIGVGGFLGSQGDQPAALISGGINLLAGLGLLVAGVLALVGGGDYQRWRQASRPPRRRPRDDYDDRPRRRRDEGDYDDPPRRSPRREDDRISE